MDKKRRMELEQQYVDACVDDMDIKTMAQAISEMLSNEVTNLPDADFHNLVLEFQDHLLNDEELVL